MGAGEGKRGGAALPPTPSECLAFLAGKAHFWPAKTTKTPKHKFPIPDLNIEKRKKKRKGTVNMDSDRQKDTIDKR